MNRIEGEREAKKGGRPPIPIDYKEAEHNGQKYVIGTILQKGSPIKFVIDHDDFEKVKTRSWHITSTNYVGSTFTTIDNVRKTLFLHNFVMNRLIFLGKGATESVDHKNRNPLDNRKANLRIVSQTEQNLNQRQKKRTTTALPAGCGIDPSEIPKHIQYAKPHGLHGDRFVIELKSEKIERKTTSSKAVSLREKLEQAKAILAELYESYPCICPAIINDEVYQMITIE